MSTPFVSARELAFRLQTPAQHSGGCPVVIDVRWELGGGADPSGFTAGHVPGAVFCDLEAVLTGPHAPDGSGGRHPLPDRGAVRQWLGDHGIEAETSLVVMDGGHGAGAARAWWVLRDAGQRHVEVLSGGLSGWEAEGLPVEEGAPSGPTTGGPSDEAVAGTPNSAGLPTVDAAALRAGLPAGTVLLDARPPARYRGEELGPDPVGGHVPGAVNLPVSCLYQDGLLRGTDEVRARFAQAGVDEDTPVVLSCGSGITALQLALAHREAFPEAGEPTLYPGSFSDWISDRSRPLATGADPGTMPPA